MRCGLSKAGTSDPARAAAGSALSSLRGACLLACIACAESAAPNRAEAPAPASAEPVAPAGLKERLPPEGARYPQGIVNPLVGVFSPL